MKKSAKGYFGLKAKRGKKSKRLIPVLERSLLEAAEQVRKTTDVDPITDFEIDEVTGIVYMYRKGVFAAACSLKAFKKLLLKGKK